MLDGLRRRQACQLLFIFTAPDQKLILFSIQIACRALRALPELPQAIAVGRQVSHDLKASSSGWQEGGLLFPAYFLEAALMIRQL